MTSGWSCSATSSTCAVAKTSTRRPAVSKSTLNDAAAFCDTVNNKDRWRHLPPQVNERLQSFRCFSGTHAHYKNSDRLALAINIFSCVKNGKLPVAFWRQSRLATACSCWTPYG